MNDPAQSAAASTTRTRRRIPARVGDFQLLERIGKGGRSYVFSARQRYVERVVALKVLRPELVKNSADFIAFRREAAAYGRFDSPHILTCYQAGQDGDWHFLALSHAEQGDTMQALAGKSRRQALQRVLKWMGHLGDAVAHLASRGFVHGDIKPANVLIAADDRAILADLGSLHPLSDNGAPRRFEGTAAYMSPEQARRQRLTELADIYAIGASAWHLLSGKAPRPLCDDKREALRRAAEDPLPGLSSVAPWVPPSVAAIIDRCLCPDPGHRYQRPSDLALAAQQVAAGITGQETDTLYPAINLQMGY